MAPERSSPIDISKMLSSGVGVVFPRGSDVILVLPEGSQLKTKSEHIEIQAVTGPAMDHSQHGRLLYYRLVFKGKVAIVARVCRLFGPLQIEEFCYDVVVGEDELVTLVPVYAPAIAS